MTEEEEEGRNGEKAVLLYYIGPVEVHNLSNCGEPVSVVVF